MTDRIESIGIIFDSNWQIQSRIGSQSKVVYGCLKDNENYLYYGSSREFSQNDLYNSPSVEIRDGLGAMKERKTYNQV